MKSVSGRVALPVLVGLLAVWTTVGCGDKSAKTTDSGSQTKGTSEVQPPAAAAAPSATGVQWTVPAGWTQEEPSSQMRKAQYRVPGAGGDAEMIVFYFGPGQGGDAMANATRWAGQFAQPDGSPSVEAMKTRKLEVKGMQVLHVDVTGTYTNQMVSNETFADYRLLGAVVEGADANWFFKLTGPASTVEGASAAFETLIASVH